MHSSDFHNSVSHDISRPAISLHVLYFSFHSDLPEFKTENGIHRHEDGVTVTSPVLMWVKAIDIILMKMLQENIDLSKITRVSGTAQQHGSVYWKKYADVALGHLDHNSSLTDQLQVKIWFYDVYRKKYTDVTLRHVNRNSCLRDQLQLKYDFHK